MQMAGSLTRFREILHLRDTTPQTKRHEVEEAVFSLRHEVDVLGLSFHMAGFLCILNKRVGSIIVHTFSASLLIPLLFTISLSFSFG